MVAAEVEVEGTTYTRELTVSTCGERRPLSDISTSNSVPLKRHWAVQPDQINHSTNSGDFSSLAEVMVVSNASERIGSGVNSAQTGSEIATREGGGGECEMASHWTNEGRQTQ